MGEVLVFLRIKHDANFALFLHAKCQRQEKTFLLFKYQHSKSVLVSIGLQVCINQYICLSKFENLGWGNKSRLHAIISGDRLFWPVLSYFGSEFVCDWESESSLAFVFCAFQFLLSWTWESQEISWRLYHHNCNPNRAAVGSYPSLFPENKFWPRDLSYFHIPKM